MAKKPWSRRPLHGPWLSQARSPRHPIRRPLTLAPRRRVAETPPLPVVVGFGIGKRAHVTEVAAHADGVVVGSALVNVIRDHLDERGKIAAVLGARAADLVAGTRR